MKILIVGGGSIGSTYGAFLSKAHDVTLLVRRYDHAQAVNNGPVAIHYRDGNIDRFQLKAVLDVSSDDQFDLILFSTKVYDLASGFEKIQCCVTPDTVLMSIQNGVQHYDLLQEAFPDNRCIGAVSYCGLNRKSDCDIIFAGIFKTFIGVNDANSDEVLLQIQKAFTDLDLHCEVQNPIKEALWKKQILTAMQQAIASLTGNNFGQLAASEYCKAVCYDLFKETQALAKTQGVNIPDQMYDDVVSGWAVSPQHKPSMVADFQAERITEIHMANGYMNELARKNGIDAPVNKTLYNIVKAIEESR